MRREGDASYCFIVMLSAVGRFDRAFGRIGSVGLLRLIAKLASHILRSEMFGRRLRLASIVRSERLFTLLVELANIVSRSVPLTSVGVNMMYRVRMIVDKKKNGMRSNDRQICAHLDCAKLSSQLEQQI